MLGNTLLINGTVYTTLDLSGWISQQILIAFAVGVGVGLLAETLNTYLKSEINKNRVYQVKDPVKDP